MFDMPTDRNTWWWLILILTPLNVHLILVLFFVVVLTGSDTAVVVLGAAVLALVGGLSVGLFVVKTVKADVGGWGRRVVGGGGGGFLPLFGGWDWGWLLFLLFPKKRKFLFSLFLLLFDLKLSSVFRALSFWVGKEDDWVWILGGSLFGAWFFVPDPVNVGAAGRDVPNWAWKSDKSLIFYIQW